MISGCVWALNLDFHPPSFSTGEGEGGEGYSMGGISEVRHGGF